MAEITNVWAVLFCISLCMELDSYQSKTAKDCFVEI